MATTAELKYNLLKKLKALPHDRYKLAKNKLPVALGVSKVTFNAWLYIRQDDPRQIPTNKLNAMAHFFNCTIDELVNEAPEIITHEQLQQIADSESRNRFEINND